MAATAEAREAEGVTVRFASCPLAAHDGNHFSRQQTPRAGGGAVHSSSSLAWSAAGATTGDATGETAMGLVGGAPQVGGPTTNTVIEGEDSW